MTVDRETAAEEQSIPGWEVIAYPPRPPDAPPGYRLQPISEFDAYRNVTAEIERLKQQLEATRAENSRLRKRRNEIDDEAEEYAEQVEVLREALDLAGKRCADVHHPKLMQHKADEPCPVEALIAAALKEDKP